MGNLAIKRVYAPPAESDGKRILVDRLWPRGLSRSEAAIDDWIKEIAIGGTAPTTPGTYNNNNPTAEGQSFHGDHLYAFYQKPENAKALPIVMLHGAYQSGRSWPTTPTGRG